MAKIVRLTENDLMRIVKRVINEQGGDNDFETFDENGKQYLVPNKPKALSQLNGMSMNLTLVGKGPRKTEQPPKNINVKVEKIYPRGESSWVTPLPTFSNVFTVHLDVTLLDVYGQETGGFFGTGIGNNLDLFYICGSRRFYIDEEDLGDKNDEIGNSYYTNQKAVDIIENNFCKKIKEAPRMKTNY